MLFKSLAACARTGKALDMAPQLLDHARRGATSTLKKDALAALLKGSTVELHDRADLLQTSASCCLLPRSTFPTPQWHSCSPVTSRCLTTWLGIVASGA